MKAFAAFVLLLCITPASAQNLVKNSSFEIHNYCPEDIGRFHKNVAYWSVLTGTTDYMNVCSRSVGFQNHNGQQIARSGNGYAGIYVFSKKDYREYIQGTLSEKLVKDKKYILTFYVSLADYATLAIKDFNVLFTNKPLTSFPFVKYKNNTLVTPKRVSKIKDLAFNFYYQPEPIFYKNKNIWMQVYIPFTAKGYETHFTIGNFFNNSKTKKLNVSNSKQEQFSYYYIDDVSIELKYEEEKTIVKKINSKKKNILSKIENNKIYTFKNVLFQFDKTTLLQKSLLELNALSGILKKDNKLTIEIYGHTDATGTKERNLELSKERAKAFANYLIYLGIAKSRIKWFGYGSLKPIANNTTEEGRAKNRRVAFRLQKE